MMTDDRGFSLTELPIVAAIILILASILIVGTGESYTAAERLACQEWLRQIDNACRMFSNAHQGRELPSLDLIGQGGAARWYERLLPYFEADSLEAAREYLNCPAPT